MENTGQLNIQLILNNRHMGQMVHRDSSIAYLPISYILSSLDIFFLIWEFFHTSHQEMLLPFRVINFEIVLIRIRTNYFHCVLEHNIYST